jgi:rare lipoprotein A
MPGRIVDLSHQAAAMLGYVNNGSTNVDVQYVGPAPLEGDDTRMLVASYSGPNDYDTGNVRVASAGGNRSLVGITTDFFGSLFSYADATPQSVDANIGSAFEAVNSMASGSPDLAAWAQSVDADNRKIHMSLGVFSNYDNAVALEEQFAILGAVDEEQVVINGTAVLRIRDGKIVEHWGGPHCQNGVGLVAGAAAPVPASTGVTSTTD